MRRHHVLQITRPESLRFVSRQFIAPYTKWIEYNVLKRRWFLNKFVTHNKTIFYQHLQSILMFEVTIKTIFNENTEYRRFFRFIDEQFQWILDLLDK